MKNMVRVKQDIHIDAPNAYTVTYNIGEETTTETVHTDQHGNGLWIDGKQITGTMQFYGGKNVREAIRRWYQKTVIS